MADTESVTGLGDFVEVGAPRTRGPLLRLLLALVAAGAVLGVVLAFGGSWLGSFAQTEAGLCRITWAPCTELSVAGVESLSGLDLPEGTEVVSGYAQELPELLEFRAEVVLPEGAGVTMSRAYEEQDGVEHLQVGDLADAGYWGRPVADGTGYDVAAVGTRSDGRTVVLFDERQVPQSP